MVCGSYYSRCETKTYRKKGVSSSKSTMILGHTYHRRCFLPPHVRAIKMVFRKAFRMALNIESSIQWQPYLPHLRRLHLLQVEIKTIIIMIVLKKKNTFCKQNLLQFVCDTFNRYWEIFTSVNGRVPYFVKPLKRIQTQLVEYLCFFPKIFPKKSPVNWF